MATGKKRRAPQRLDESKLWEYSLRLLAGRGYSTRELRSKLVRRAAEKRDVDKVIERLTESKLLDDRRFAEAFASARKETAGLGRYRVLRDLRQKQISGDLAGEVVDNLFEETDEAEMVEAYLKRKFRNTDLPNYLSEPKRLAAAYRRLRYAGFSSSVSIRVLRRYSEMADELENMEGE